MKSIFVSVITEEVLNHTLAELGWREKAAVDGFGGQEAAELDHLGFDFSHLAAKLCVERGTG